MLKNLRVYKLGTTYKYVSTKLVNYNLSQENGTKFKLNDNQKFFTNIIRAKTTIKNLILCNNFKYFVTLTFNTSFNRYDLKQLRTKVNNKLRKLRKLTGLPFRFLLVPEQHKNGAWHFHGCFDSSLDQFMYINNNLYLSCEIFDIFGFNSFSFIDNKDKVSSYMTKYITKDFKNREKGQHLYFASQNLEKPKIIEDFIYDIKLLKESFFDYRNDFCSTKFSSINYNLSKLLRSSYQLEPPREDTRKNF